MIHLKNSKLRATLLGTLIAALSATSLDAKENNDETSEFPQKVTLKDPGFEKGRKALSLWRSRSWGQKGISRDARTGKYAVQVGPERGRVGQDVPVKPNSLYRATAWVKTELASEEVELYVMKFGGAKMKSVSSPLVEWNQITLDFETGTGIKSVLIGLQHPGGPGIGLVDDVELTYLGPAPEPTVQEFVQFPKRELKSKGGVEQLPDETIDWFYQDKFGMFIHWGVYAAMNEGSEWVMHQRRMSPETYKKRAEDPEKGFTAKDFDPKEWVEVAKTAGMRYMVLTTRHHDGYALFDSKHENAWTSQQQLGRDLIREYVDAVREGGLRVGLYYSPMSWRYPGYFDPEGTGAKPNVWNYKTSPDNKESARVMREEVYEQVTNLMKNYGKIEYMFWDGGWLAQSINRPLEQRFWNPGKYQDEDTPWPIAEKYITREPGTNKALGIMGIVRKYQPTMMANERFGWIGDVKGEEGAYDVGGEIRTEETLEKCFSITKGWGFRAGTPVMASSKVIVHLANCVTRDMNLLLNVAPNRHGVIPENQQKVLREIGSWLDKVGEAVFETRAGPWQPRFAEYGFTYSGNRIFCFIQSAYRSKAGPDTFVTHSVGSKQVTGVRNLSTGEKLSFARNKDNTITISGIDYKAGSPVTVLELTLDSPVYD